MKILGHKFEKDIFELVRACLPGINIRFIKDDIRNYNFDLFLNSSVHEASGEIRIETKLLKGNIILSESLYLLRKEKFNFRDLQKEIKLRVKGGVYEVLSGISTKNVPWGILTGIRPMKVVHALHNEGHMEEEITNILIDDYKFTRDKASLVVNMLGIQRKHIYPLDENSYSIYLSIPFCPSKCHYCSFPSFKIEDNIELVDKYIETLIYELENILPYFDEKHLKSIYIGGGTPTAINIKALEKLIKFLRLKFPYIDEFTVEAGRPDTIRYDVLKVLKAYEVSRISINPQTMNDDTLQLVGRNHDSKSILKAHKLAKEIGFDIINMDLILGLPGENLNKLRKTLKAIKFMDPENLTIHTLAYKRGSRLFEDKLQGIKGFASNIEQMLDETINYTINNGYVPYYLYRQKQTLGNLENIGYSKKDKECIYNISMMEEKQTILGVGLGSVTKIYNLEEDRIIRVPNYKSFKDYLSRVDELLDKKKNYLKEIIN